MLIGLQGNVVTMFKHILISIDDSTLSRKAIRMGVQLARVLNGGGPRCLDSLMGGLSSESLGY
jgi:hypothetical protein